jgi:23S rRNA pseudouridine2457 synthase
MWVAGSETSRLSLISTNPAMAEPASPPLAARYVLTLLNKPYGVLCQFSADGSGKPTLAEFVKEPGIYAAGRLDADSEGLVLLTSVGPLQARITHPKRKLAKTYWVQVEGAPNEGMLDQLRRGVALPDFMTAAAKVTQIPEPSALWPRDPPIRVRRAIPTAWLEISLTEGKNRQVRRMTAAVGLPTLRLIRHSIGPWTLKGLAPGAWRHEPVDFRVL